MFGPRVADPIWASGLLRPQKQAGHMIASDPIARACKSSCNRGAVHICNRGAVHIWVPALAALGRDTNTACDATSGPLWRGSGMPDTRHRMPELTITRRN